MIFGQSGAFSLVFWDNVDYLSRVLTEKLQKIYLKFAVLQPSLIGWEWMAFKVFWNMICPKIVEMCCADICLLMWDLLHTNFCQWELPCFYQFQFKQFLFYNFTLIVILLTYCPEWRITATNAIKHGYFSRNRRLLERNFPLRLLTSFWSLDVFYF